MDRYAEIAERILAEIHGIYPPDQEPDEEPEPAPAPRYLVNELEPLSASRFTDKAIIVTGYGTEHQH